MENLQDLIEEAKQDTKLRPYFLDFIGKNIVLGMTDVFTVNAVDRTRIQKDFYDSLHMLSQQLHNGIYKDRLDKIIEEVCIHYLGKIGRVKFERYGDINSRMS